MYLVVGGHAFAVHAHPRYMGDLDIFVEASAENAQRILHALKDFGCDSPDVTPKDLTTLGRVIQIGFPPRRIDLLTKIDGVECEDAWGRRVESNYGDERISVISKADLVANKRASGLKHDLLDLDSLT